MGTVDKFVHNHFTMGTIDQFIVDIDQFVDLTMGTVDKFVDNHLTVGTSL